MRVPSDQTESRLATLHPGAGVLRAGQGADAAGHGKPHDLLGLVIDDEVPRRLEPHRAAGGSGGEEAFRAGAFIPPAANIGSVTRVRGHFSPDCLVNRESYNLISPLNRVKMLSLGANKARSRSAELLVIVLNPYLCPLREGWDSSNEINICYQVIKNIQALKNMILIMSKGGACKQLLP